MNNATARVQTKKAPVVPNGMSDTSSPQRLLVSEVIVGNSTIDGQYKSTDSLFTIYEGFTEFLDVKWKSFKKLPT